MMNYWHCWRWWINSGNGGGNNGKYRFVGDDVGINGNGNRGNDGGPTVGGTGP